MKIDREKLRVIMLNKMRDNAYKTLLDCLIESMESYLTQENYVKKPTEGK